MSHRWHSLAFFQCVKDLKSTPAWTCSRIKSFDQDWAQERSWSISKALEAVSCSPKKHPCSLQQRRSVLFAVMLQRILRGLGSIKTESRREDAKWLWAFRWPGCPHFLQSHQHGVSCLVCWSKGLGLCQGMLWAAQSSRRQGRSHFWFSSGPKFASPRKVGFVLTWGLI